MLAGLFFIIFRLLELCFLIPVLGMLSSIVHGYVSNNELAPSFVLVLFIVVVIASVWALFSAMCYPITKHHGYFIALMDLLIFGGLIGGVVVLAVVNHLDCSNPNLRNTAYLESGPFLYHFGGFCNLLRACFALGILLIILFFFTTVSNCYTYNTPRMRLMHLVAHRTMDTSPSSIRQQRTQRRPP